MLNGSQEHINKFDNVSFSEDSLQRYIKHNKVSFIKRLSFLVVLWSIIIGYFISPLSKVGTPTVTGIKNLTINDVVDIARLNSSDYIWQNNTVEQIELLAKHPLIKEVDMSVNIFGVHIEIEENYPLARYQTSFNDDGIACFDYYLNDLSYLSGETVFQSAPLTKAIKSMEYLPLLTNIDNQEMLESVLTQLAGIDYEIIKNIISVSYAADYLETDEITVIKLLINKNYLNLDSDLILYVDMNRMSYKINKNHLEIISKNITSSAKTNDDHYCLSYLSNQTASCKEIILNK